MLAHSNMRLRRAEDELKREGIRYSRRRVRHFQPRLHVFSHLSSRCSACFFLTHLKVSHALWILLYPCTLKWQIATLLLPQCVTPHTYWLAGWSPLLLSFFWHQAPRLTGSYEHIHHYRLPASRQTHTYTTALCSWRARAPIAAFVVNKCVLCELCDAATKCVMIIRVLTACVRAHTLD